MQTTISQLSACRAMTFCRPQNSQKKKMSETQLHQLFFISLLDVPAHVILSFLGF